MTKKDVLKYFGKLPTTKLEHMIIRQVGHPLGDWIISKPTRKHVYILTVTKL